MAYMNFAEVDAVALGGTHDWTRTQSGFSGLEWSVIALARRDRLTSLNQPSRVAQALGALFGTWKNARLADSRLEALRRMAVLAWHKSYVVPVSEIRAFKEAGFTTEQYETLQASISRGRAQSGKRSA